MNDKAIMRQMQNLEYQPAIYKQAGHTITQKEAAQYLVNPEDFKSMKETNERSHKKVKDPKKRHRSKDRQ